MVAWTIYLSFLGAAALLILPRGLAGCAKGIALGTSVAGFCISLVAATRPGAAELCIISQAQWIPTLGISWLLASDGISMVLLLLTGIAAIAGVLFSWNVEYRAREFFALFLTLIGSVYGVFLSFDLFLLFVFYELAIIPKYFLIAIWGSTRREYAAMKLALYSYVGSALVLIGIIAAYVQAGSSTMNLMELSRFSFSPGFQTWAFPVVFIGFGILAGLWPFHSWAPTGHVAAPTPASMLLAGVIMKLGAYGCLRVALVLFPGGLEPWASSFLGVSSWREMFALLAVAGIGYGALAALVQRDFKFVIGYSSVSHMGFVLFGLVTLNTLGLSGAVLQMLSHGLIAGLLFAVVGRMIYERAHTRDLAQLQPMNLHTALPFASVTFTLAGLASMGLPGFSGFIAELHVLLGGWQSFPKLTILAGLGVLLAVAYTLRAIQKGFHREGPAEPITETFPPVTLAERAGALLLLACSILIGVYPRLLINLIEPSLNSDLFAHMRKAGGI